MAEKVCPVVIREEAGVTRLLAFDHPTAGKQFVKGSIEDDETALEAATRELEEESGIVAAGDVLDLGEAPIGSSVWHLFALRVTDLPERWDHRTRDDFGHTFAFFWHPLSHDLGDDWHPQFHEALQMIRRSLQR